MSAASALGRGRIGRNLAIALVGFCAFLAVLFLNPFSTFNESLLAYLTIVWWAVLLGLLVGGCID